MQVQYNYLPFEFKSNEKIFKEWKKLIKSTDFTLGKYVKKFESDFKKFVKAKYCVATNNGTDALILALKSIGIKKGDEVITVCNSFYATAGAIIACGAKPVFVDCDDRYQIDVEAIEKKISLKTKAIVPVHWGGASPNMSKIIKIAKRKKIKVIEDACMGIGAKIFNKSPGTFGDVGAYSMHPLKSLNVMGDGGMVTTNNKDFYNWMIRFRNHGMIDRDNIDFWGVNMRIQPLQAIVAIENLKKIKRTINIRNKNAKFLDAELKKLYPHVILPERKKNYTETFALYMGLFEDRDNLIKYLKKNKIDAKIHYPIPLHLQKPALKMGYKSGNFRVAEKQAKNLITLPVHQFLSIKQLKYIVYTIKSFYKKKY